MKKKPLAQRDFASLKSFDKVLGRFREQYRLIHKPRFILQRRYFDTFDWRLYLNGNVLEVDNLAPRSDAPATDSRGKPGPGQSICRLRTLGKRGGQVAAPLKQDPDFSWNFDRQDLRQCLEPIIAARRMLLQAETQVSIEPFEVTDDAGKVLLRLELEKYLRPDHDGRHRSVLVNCRFNPLQGYGKVCKQLLELIDNEPGMPDKTVDPFISILSQENITPADYISKFNIVFDPEKSIGQALAQALLFHMNVMRRNLPGLKADLDTEFLHDFRIANRRSRTLLTQVKNVLPPVQQKYYRSIFSWLSNETSEHRDLDVFLHDIPHYLTLLPRNMRADLEPLRHQLEKKREKAHARLLKTLSSERFLRFEAEYQTYLADALDSHFGTDIGKLPVMEIANKSIWRVYQKLLKQGRYASKTGDREAVHELRKTGKKFRYLLETFRSLYPVEDIEQVIMHCRKLQNLLGRIVDYRVQQSYLLGLLGGSGKQSGLPASTDACIRHLADTYSRLEDKAHGKFEGRFTRFSNPKSQELFKAIFRETHKPAYYTKESR